MKLNQIKLKTKDCCMNDHLVPLLLFTLPLSWPLWVPSSPLPLPLLPVPLASPPCSRLPLPAPWSSWSPVIGSRGKIYVHNNLCTLENHEKANRIIIISGTIICEGSKFFPYLQFGILSSGSHEKIHNICINVIIKLHFVFADILDVWSYQKHEFWSWLW